MEKQMVEDYLNEKKYVLEESMQALGRERLFYVPVHLGYVRISTFELIAEEIRKNNVAGAVAELGVYRGDFARYINEAFPEKRFYLFDTFEGFAQKDVFIEKAHNYSSGMQDFSDTNVALVLDKMINPDSCIIKKGYFPDSIEGLEDDFAFVSLDADLYQPIFEGLKYFYPRLSKGGFIFIHDYNNAEYKGVKKAVTDYCSDQGVPFVPICDPWGTAVIAK
ncbi:TylF/MycF family methyltransferase [Niabella sp. CC-SYL272]|uniref:TylF/MycF/NovP-related O-methyltransferase n=1 Tax=Niabella agricola TaxID=2891571 RepID=UPI001F464C61|nr:TylF/MycF/NovP-related O-methyltransferase [Niabella agricola]MCF3109476.1 TylF/MycF family methyltransferase [Niabella agricola]